MWLQWCLKFSKGWFTLTHNNPTLIAFINYASFTKCITKIDGTIIDDAEDLNWVMSIYNLIELSSNYSNTTGSLWFCSKYEAANLNAIIVNTHAFKSFLYKLLGNTVPNGNNSMSKQFWPLSNCKIELKLRWMKHCVLALVGVENNNADSNSIFTITGTQLYVLVVTLSAKDNQELSKLRSKGFERSVYWNKYKIKSENKNMKNEYRYFLKSNLAGVNQLFFGLFKST